MPQVGFEPTIAAGERPYTYALDCAATGTGNSSGMPFQNCVCMFINWEVRRCSVCVCARARVRVCARARHLSIYYRIPSLRNSVTGTQIRGTKKDERYFHMRDKFFFPIFSVSVTGTKNCTFCSVEHNFALRFRFVCGLTTIFLLGELGMEDQQKGPPCDLLFMGFHQRGRLFVKTKNNW